MPNLSVNWLICVFCLLCQVTEACRETVWFSATRDGAAVPLALYYETLCPDCKNFIQTQLWPAYQKVGSIMNVTLVPYGNAWVICF